MAQPVFLLEFVCLTCREAEREAIETGIEETKTSLQVEDIRLIQEFTLVSKFFNAEWCIFNFCRKLKIESKRAQKVQVFMDN
jgi:hypothetical protein